MQNHSTASDTQFQNDNYSHGAMTRLVREREGADILGVSQSFLQKDRLNERSRVPWVKIGTAIRYKLADLTTFLEASRRTGNDNRAAA